MELYALVIFTALGIPLLIAFVAWFEERTSPSLARETSLSSAGSPSFEAMDEQSLVSEVAETSDAPTPLIREAEPHPPDEQRPAA
jgi:hypothetical protein